MRVCGLAFFACFDDFAPTLYRHIIYLCRHKASTYRHIISLYRHIISLNRQMTLRYRHKAKWYRQITLRYRHIISLYRHTTVRFKNPVNTAVSRHHAVEFVMPVDEKPAKRAFSRKA